jgi:hypothetical protein
MGALLVMLGLVGGLAVVLTGFLGPAGVARADTTPDNNDNPYFTLTMTPSATQNLVDGQAMPFTVTRTALGQSTGLEIAAVGTGWCASDVQLPVSQSPGNQSFDARTTGFPLVNSSTPGAPALNCLDYVNSDLSSIIANGTSLPAIVPQPNTVTNVAGTAGDYPTVSGQALAEVGQGGQQGVPFNGISVNCLPSDPCTFAVAVWTENVLTPGKNVYFVGVPVTFLDSSAGLACNGPAPGQVASASPDRLSEPLTELGIDACGSGIGGGQGLTDNLGAGYSDDKALCAFASDSVDLAYSAVGYGASGSDFSPANCQGGAAPARPYVAIPIALNAVVLAHTANEVQTPPYGGFGTALTGYSPLKITLGEFAQLLSNGGYEDVSGSGQVTSDSGTWGSQLGQGLLALNPQLSGGLQNACAGCTIVGSGGPGVGVAATSGTDATTYLATSFLDALVPSQLASAPNAQAAFGSEPLGTTSDFGNPPPAYDVQTYTGRSILAHYTTPLSGSAWWALTDAATAAATWGGFDDFALQTPDSLAAAPAQATYVAPTESSMQAAVANMTAQPDGTLLPNPNGGAVNGVEPYPLTYVEYAIAPAQPLLNSDCTPNTAGQTAMSEWLTYLVNQGQAHLPAGMAPMPSTLVAQATADIAKVGAAAPACTPTAAAAGSSSSPTSAGAGSSSSSSSIPSGSTTATPYALGSSDLNSDVPATVDGSTSSQTSHAKTAGISPTASSRAAALSLAAFGTVSAASWALPLFGILVLTLLLPGLVLLMSGRSLSGALGGLRSPAKAAAAGVQPVEEGLGET